MEIVRYWGNALRRAFSDTFTFLGWNKKSLIFPILFVVGLLIYWKLRGVEAVKEELDVFFAFVLAPIGSYTVLLFLWNLIAAPVRLKQDTERTLNENKAKLEEEKESLQAQLKELSDKNPSITVLPQEDGCLRVENSGAEGKFTAKAQTIYESQPEGEVWFIKWANSLEKEQVIPRGDFSILEVASYESEIVYTNDHPRRIKPFIRFPRGRRVVSREGTQEMQVFDRDLSPRDESVQIEVRIFSSPEMRSPFKQRYLLKLIAEEDIVSIKEVPTETSNEL